MITECFSELVSGSPCTVRATGSHLIVNIVESRGDEMSQEPDPSELPITGKLQFTTSVHYNALIKITQMSFAEHIG